MSEANTLAKLVIVLGIVFLLIGLIYPGQDAAWTGFRSALSTGPSFPTFDNPFAGPPETSSNVQLTPTRTWVPQNRSTVGTNNGCGNSYAIYWRCVRDVNGTDANQSYVRSYVTTPGFYKFSVNLSGIIAGTLRSFSASIICKTSGNQPLSIFVQLFQYNGAYNLFHGGNSTAGKPNVYFCPSNKFAEVVIPNVPVSSWYKSDEEVYFDMGIAGPEFDVPAGEEIWTTTIRVSAVFSSRAGETSCAGNDFFTNLGCQLGSFFDFVVKVGTYIVNGIVFVIATAVALGSFVFNVATNLLFGLISTFGWFFAIPGAPPVVQILIASIFVGLIAWVLFVVMNKAVGLFGGINPL